MGSKARQNGWPIVSSGATLHVGGGYPSYSAPAGYKWEIETFDGEFVTFDGEFVYYLERVLS